MPPKVNTRVFFGRHKLVPMSAEYITVKHDEKSKAKEDVVKTQNKHE